MKKGKKQSTQAACKEEPKSIEPSTNNVLLFRKTLIFYPILTDTCSKLRKTRHIKYAGKLICPQDRKLPSKFKNLKKLDNLVINYDPSRSARDLIAPSKFIKALNPFKKHVKVFYKDKTPLHLSLFAHIHNLYRLNLSLHYSLLKKKVRFITSVRSIVLSFNSHRFADFFLNDKRAFPCFDRVMRHIVSFQCLRHFKIRSEFNHSIVSKIAAKLKAIPSLCSSLKKFDIYIENIRFYCIQQVCPYVTKLSVVFVSLDLETIKCLTRLDRFKFRAHGRDSHSDLALIGNLPNLKKLEIEVDRHEPALLDSFLEKFSVPSCLESFKLNMNRITLRHLISKTPFKSFKNFPHFIKKLAALSQLKTLCVTTRDQTYGSKLIEDFVTSLLNQMKSLESLTLTNTNSGRPGETNCLDLDSIVDGIYKLKSPIHDITIQDIKIAQKSFDKTVNLFKMKGVQKMTIEGLSIDNTDQFTDVLELLTQVPEGKTLTLRVNAEEVDDADGLSEKLLTFLKKAKLKGEVYLYVCDLKKKVKDKYEKQLKVRAIENKIFKALKVRTKRGLVILDT